MDSSMKDNTSTTSSNAGSQGHNQPAVATTASSAGNTIYNLGQEQEDEQGHGHDEIPGPPPIVRDFAYDPITTAGIQVPIEVITRIAQAPDAALPRPYVPPPTSVNQYTYRDVPVSQSNDTQPMPPLPSPARLFESMMPPPPPPPSPARHFQRLTNPLSSSSSSASTAVAAAGRLTEVAARQLAYTTRRQQRLEAAVAAAAAAPEQGEPEWQSQSSSLPSVSPRVSPRLALARERRRRSTIERIERLREEARDMEPPPTPSAPGFTSPNLRLSRDSNLRLGRSVDHVWDVDRNANLERAFGVRRGDGGGDGHGHSHGYGRRHD
ncbi:hypothetical protein SLS62_008864 [Diatrype stigma]|uniref:Uncharacterized protein n=1 Tax=Diatrype stigma TaxID=117547 RepID=A0AAN9YJU4_9PEZI